MTVGRLLLRATWIGLSGLIVASALIVFFAWLALQVDWKVPDPLALTGPTTITARDGTVLARFDSEVDRRVISLDDISRVGRDAIVASEDERFYQHRGVDPLGLLRAIVSNVRTGRVHQGGSTLTQQYVKNAFVGDDRTLLRKVREAVISVQLERRLSKNQILERYLNTVYFGEGAYGIEAAALTYFGVQARDLTAAQGATLAQLLPAPSERNPRVDPEGAIGRRDEILHDMLRLGTLTQARLDRALATPLRLIPEEQPRYAVPYFVNYVRAELEAAYGEEALLTGALDVHTTIDLEAQAQLEQSVAAQLPEEAENVDAGAIALDPRTGHIIAMYGGHDFYDPSVPYAQVNLATQGNRQPGSTFKPFVFIAALEQGMSPETTYDAPARVTIGDWDPANADLSDHGRLTLAEAMVGSVNTVFAQLGVDVGPEAIVDVASRLGVRKQIEPEITISLGAGLNGPTVLDMTSAFGAIGNDGIACPATAILEVRGPEGELVPPPQTRRAPGAAATAAPTAAPTSLTAGRRCTQAVDRDIARTTTQVLEEVVASGTGTRADIGRPQAGKTGTTDDYADAWYVGYTPDLALGVWVGDPTQRRSLRDIAGFDAVFGGTVPALIWHDAAEQFLADTPPTEFPEPGEASGRRPGPTSRKSPVPGPTATATPTVEPTATLTPRERPSETPTDEPTTTPSASEEPTDEPSESPTPSTSPSPSSSPSPSPSPSPSETGSDCIPLVTCDP